jgi:hypothetical protein
MTLPVASEDKEAPAVALSRAQFERLSVPVWSGQISQRGVAGAAPVVVGELEEGGVLAAVKGPDRRSRQPHGTATIDRESRPRSAVGGWGYIGPGPCSLGGASAAYAQTVVITGWRASLLTAVAVFVTTAVLAALAFLVLGIAVSIVAFLLIIMPVVLIVALVAWSFQPRRA